MTFNSYSRLATSMRDDAMFDQQITFLADQLEELLLGRMTSFEFEAKYRGVDLPPLIEHLMSSIEHFLSDSDIRARDTKYRAMQEGEMRRLIECLRTGRLDEANRITFLRSTGE